MLNYVRAFEIGMHRLPELPLSSRLIREMHAGRLLIVFYLAERRVHREPLLYLSGYFERHRDEYRARLQAVREEGAYESWIRFFLEAVAAQAAAAVDTTDALLRLGATFRERLAPVPGEWRPMLYVAREILEVLERESG